jgi:hypothetical protein
MPSSLETKQLLGDAFFEHWEQLRGNSLSPYFKIILETFDFDSIQSAVDNDLIAHPERRVWHERTLKRLATLYAKHLYDLSYRGKNLNFQTISEAKVALKNSGSCKIYPC